MSILKSQNINDGIRVMKPIEDLGNIGKSYKLSVSSILAKRALIQESESRFFLKTEVIIGDKTFYF